MPKRPDSHVVEDLALNMVTNVCSQCGWASEVVHKDYGDDVLVQPSLNAEIDHNRIWIQIKGTRSINRFHSAKYGYSMRVSFDHALKWVRSADLTVVVLWDVERNFGLWSIPRYNVDTWDWLSLKSRKARLIFDKEARFCSEQLIKIGWRARIEHYFGLISRTVLDEKNADTGEGALLKSVVPLIVLDFLSLIGVVSGKILNKEYTRIYDTELRDVERNMHYRELLSGDLIRAYETILFKLKRDELDKYKKKLRDPSGELAEKYYLPYLAAVLAVEEALRKVSGGCTAPIEMIRICGEVVFDLLHGFDPTDHVIGKYSMSDLL